MSENDGTLIGRKCSTTAHSCNDEALFCIRKQSFALSRLEVIRKTACVANCRCYITSYRQFFVISLGNADVLCFFRRHVRQRTPYGSEPSWTDSKTCLLSYGTLESWIAPVQHEISLVSHPALILFWTVYYTLVLAHIPSKIFSEILGYSCWVII